MGIKVGALKKGREEQLAGVLQDLVHRQNRSTEPGNIIPRSEKMKQLSFIQSIQNVSVLEKIVDTDIFPRDFDIALNNYYDYDRLVCYVSFYLNGSDGDAVQIISNPELAKSFFSDRIHENASHELGAGEAYEMMVLHQRLVGQGKIIDPNAYVEYEGVKVGSFSKLFPDEMIEQMIRYLANDCEVKLEDTFFLDRLSDRNKKTWLNEGLKMVSGDLIRYRAVDYALSCIGLHWYKMKDTLEAEKAAAEKEQQEREANMKAELEEQAEQEKEKFNERMESCASAIMRDQALGAQGMQQHYVKDWEQANNMKVTNYILLATDSGLQYVSQIDFLHENDTEGSAYLSKPSELKALDTVGKNYSPRELVERTFKPDVLYLQEYFHAHPRTFESKEVYEAWREVTLNARDVLEQVKQLPPVEVNPEEDPDAQMARLAAYDIEFQSFKRGINVLRHQFNVVRHSTSDVFWNNQLEEFERELFAEYDLTHLTRDALAYARDIDAIVAKINELEERINTRENIMDRDGAYYQLVSLLLKEGAFAEEVKRFRNGEVIVSLPKEKRRKKTFKRLAKTLGLKRKEFRYLLEVKKTDVSAAYDNVMEPRETE